MPDPEFLRTLSLVRDAQAGDRQALESLFERYLPRVRQIVALRLGYRIRDFALHEDIVQEAMSRSFQRLEQFEGTSEGSFRNWMATCVASTINDHFRKEGAAKRGGGKVRVVSSAQREDLTSIVFAGDDPTPSSIVGRKELVERIEACLLEMKEHQRELILLRLFCGMSHREISEAMGFGDEVAARKAFSRALSQLRRRVES